ncbi:MAG: hypothetical protein RJA59_1223 [Pseudomonadota bacterium]
MTLDETIRDLVRQEVERALREQVEQTDEEVADERLADPPTDPTHHYVNKRAEPCESCGWKPPRYAGGTSVMHIHHITARCAGGGDNPENLIRLCPNCHVIAHRLLYVRKPGGWNRWPTTREDLLTRLGLLYGTVR